MGVNVEVTGVETDEREYPWIGHLGGLVVLFSANSVGTVVADEDGDGEDWNVGDHSDEFDMDMFDAFEGNVKLANDGVEIIALEDDE